MNTQKSFPRTASDYGGATPTGGDSGDIVNLYDLIRNIWYRKWIVIAAAMLLGGFVALGVSFVTPRYGATAKVMLNPRETRVVTSQEVVSDLDLSNPVIESEVALMGSSVLLEAAVRRIGPEHLTEFNPEQTSEPSVWAQRLEKVVGWATAFLVGDPSAEPEIAWTEDGENGGDGTGDGSAATTETVNPNDTIERRIVGRMRGFLTIKQQGSSYVISISGTAEDPELVALIVNTVAEEYIASQLEERIQGTRRATAWLETRVEDLRSQVAMAEEAVEVRRAEKLTADGGGLETASQQLGAMSAQLASARADQAAAQSRYDQITALIESDGFAAAADVLSSPLVVTFRTTYAALMRDRAELASRYGDDHPQLVRIDAEIARAEEDLSSEVEKIIKGLGREVEVAGIRERTIASDLLSLEERVSSISRTSTDLRDLEREANALREVYENMLARLKETRAHEALAQAEAKVIEFALPPGSPSYPRSKLLVSAAAVAGAGLGLGLVLILELSSNTFRTTQQVVRDTGVPVLTALPRGRGRRRRRAPDVLNWLADASNDGYGERVRQLRTALMFGSGEPPRSVGITSSLVGEGKTETALALAHANALLGKRVILVDCDFRRAALSKVFGWYKPADFVAVLRGKATLDDAILTDRALSFDVLSVAAPVDNVSDILDPDRFHDMISDLEDRYDLVIVDVPALVYAADARLIARSTGALVYLVKWNGTPKSTVRQGLDALGAFGIIPHGVVLTEVKRNRISEFRQGGHGTVRREGRA